MKRLGIIIATFLMGLLVPINVNAQTPGDICHDYEWEVLKIVNTNRMANGLQPISTFSSIQSSCDVRAKEVATYFSHTRPNGKSCFTALDEKGIDYWTAGENIAAGYWDPASVMNGWMNSPGHRANILTSSFDHIGVGYTTGGGYGTAWVQLFIGGCSPTSIEVAGPISSAKVGMKIEDMNLYLKINCNDSTHGESYCPINSKMCSGYSQSSTKSQQVTVNYQGLSTKFYVGPTPKPKQVTNLSLVKRTKSSVKITWKKIKCDGYDVFMKRSGGSYKKVKTVTKNTTHTVSIKNLKKKTVYYFKVKAYNKSGSKKVYGTASKGIKVKTLAK